MNGPPRADRDELNRNLIIFGCTAPAAFAIFLIFRAIFQNLMVTAAAVGELDSTTQSMIAMGWIAMVGGTGVFGAIALVAAIRALLAWKRARRAP
jgi:hypothetical protein